ncbi:MAG: polysaccharide deacetylase [Paenibacillus dendritiformis]|uniref:YkoP family protein n=1 Tax=Paenibacillus dendritiformis TaxID=130049 RepID=UPI001F3D597F|nr:polysaccharide deacetylase [Paenibacillus dendritiformis]MDU5145495.1 polysaccharide deacetylase [Paenibacillus dendritiformis]
MLASTSKACVQGLWMMWERAFDLITKARSVSVSQYGICKLVVRRYHGRSMQCNDGQWVHPGDWVGELHLDNRQVLELSRSHGPNRAALMTARQLREALHQISRAIDGTPELGKVTALTGITLLHRGIIYGLGFELHPMKSKWLRWTTTHYLRLLLAVMHPSGTRRVKQNSGKLNPMVLMMTKRSLLERYRQDVIPCQS